MDLTSKDYSWEYVTTSRKISDGPCELIYAYLAPSAATTDTVLYNNKNAEGKVVVTMKAAAVTGHKFTPKVPVYCENGLYVSLSANASGIFVQWRNL